MSDLPQMSLPLRSGDDDATRARFGCSGPALVLAVLLLLSVLLNGLLGLGLLGAAAGGGDPASNYQEILVDGKAEQKDKIVIVPIEGMIMETMGTGRGSVTSVITMLKKIEKDESVKGILLFVDSPGGGVTASDRIYHELARFRQESKLPMVSLFGDVAASGGYYVAMATDHIIAHRTSITGSIGVISQFYNFHEAMQKLGLKVNTIKSLNNQGEQSFKDMGSPYRPMRPEEEELFQNLITDMWNRFTEVVAEGRQGKLTLEEVRSLADGRIFTGPEALEKKLIDQVGYREDAYAKIRELAQAPEAKIVRYQRNPGLAELLRADSQPTDLSLLSNFTQRCPRFLYLWSGH